MAILSKKPQNLHLHDKSKIAGFNVHFSDSQRIQDLQDRVIRVSHMLDMNLSIFENLLADADIFTKTIKTRPQANVYSNNVNDLGGSTLASDNSSLLSILTLAARTKASKCCTENLLRRLDGSFALVRSILDAQALEALQSSSRTTAELAVLAREDAKKAKRSARTLNTITILGFVYLPASFVAVSQLHFAQDACFMRTFRFQLQTRSCFLHARSLVNSADSRTPTQTLLGTRISRFLWTMHLVQAAEYRLCLRERCGFSSS
jgi:hypothetical protein